MGRLMFRRFLLQAGLTLLADSDINPNESQAASPASFSGYLDVRGL
jgi:hypothetical protein